MRAAVLGSPITHSLSPTLHRAAYAHLGLTGWTYAAHEVDRAGLPAFLAGLGPDWRGLSLTMPLKEAALTVAESASEVARVAGAANTLVRREDGGWDADNTDVAGLVAALTAVDHDGRATVLGAGATARSALLALARLGVTDVTVAARRPEAVQALGAWAGDATGVRVAGTDLGRWADEPTRLVVSTVPAAPSAAVAATLDGSDGGAWDGATLLDVVYADWPTPLARAAAEHRLRVISGLDMLVHQAVEQVWLFTGTGSGSDARRGALAAVMMRAGRAELLARGATRP